MRRGKNPFLFSLKYPVHKGTITDKILVSSESTGVETDGKNNKVPITRTYWVDHDERCSVFCTKELDAVMDRLDLKSTAVLMYIIRKVEYSKDSIQLTTETIMKVLKIKSRSIAYQVRDSLIEENLIAHGYRNGEYWINPFFIFKGSRVKYFPDNMYDVRDKAKREMYNDGDC